MDPTEWTGPRLTPDQEFDAIMDHAEFVLGDNARDDEDAQETTYQVVDEKGYSDGSGIWTPV